MTLDPPHSAERAWTAAPRLLSSTTTRASGRCCVEYLGGHGYACRAADSGAAMRAEIERDLPDLSCSTSACPAKTA